MMASRVRWRKLLHAVCAGAQQPTKLVASAAAGSALALYLQHSTSSRDNLDLTRATASVFASTAHAASPAANPPPPSKTGGGDGAGTRERRFIDFATIRMGDELFMTPQDFLESVTEQRPRPRIGHFELSKDQARAVLSSTPCKNSSNFFRSLQNRGLISYTEYLFLLCILTKPKAGFDIAFNMFDTDGNRVVDKTEFLVLEEIFEKRTTAGTESSQSLHHSKAGAPDTTLLVHFFGMDGKRTLTYDEFFRFMDNLQTEILEMEFLSFSRGMPTISIDDFARSLLRFTDIVDVDKQVDSLRAKLPKEGDDAILPVHKGVNFDEFRAFFKFLNNTEDFAIAMHMYALAGRSIGQDEFKRAVRVSTGHELSDNVVNTVFKIFDKDGDNKLSYVEFIGAMKDRVRRGFRGGKEHVYIGWSGFKKCLRHEMRLSKEA